MEEKIYTIFGGANGVGKSSILGIFKARRGDELGRVIDADKLNLQFGGDIIKGGREAVRQIAECLEKEESFTQETTLSGHKTLATIKKAKAKGYTIRLYYVGISCAEESLARIENRVRKGGHDIPRNDVIRRYKTRFDDLKKILPLCDQAEFWDNENGFALCAFYINGKFRIIGEDQPDWVIPEWIKILDKELRK